MGGREGGKGGGKHEFMENWSSDGFYQRRVHGNDDPGLTSKCGQEKLFKCLVNVESGKGLRQPQSNPNVRSMILPNYFRSQIRPYSAQLCNSVNTSDFITAVKQLGRTLDKQTAVPFFSAFSQMISQQTV